ncbi:MAG: peptidoglycan DD-metalloendopeptidase family protein [Bacteroidetes bacterium]|nr:peptidoglycan DD-metalloendopeptidase family protein [Bacteroidota bacterium]
MPVEDATKKDYHPKSFWFYPWGRSGVHKGVDIFAKKGTPVFSAVPGLVISTGNLSMGGNYVLVLGPKWRLHYYAHLDSIKTRTLKPVNRNSQIGSVGNTGNAAGKPAHLHYSIFTVFPYPWRADSTPQGWKKMFFLNPIEAIEHK